MTISGTLECAFNDARIRKQDAHKKWVSASWLIGGYIPNTLAPVSMQHVGDLDQLLRCMEEEFVSGLQSGFFCHYQCMFSEIWVCKIYEVLRSFKERKPEIFQPFEELFVDLELLRITFDKFQIAKDKKLNQPVEMVVCSQKGGDPSPHSIYDPKDSLRGHIMPTGVDGDTGAVMWLASDVLRHESRWISRQKLSDDFFCCADKIEPAGVAESRKQALSVS